MKAASRGSIEIVSLLLDYKASVNLVDKQDNTALIHAIKAKAENVDVVTVLLDNCKTKDIFSNTTHDTQRLT